MNLDRYFSYIINDAVKNYTTLDQTHQDNLKMKEIDDQLELALEVPGVKSDDLKITVQKDILNINAKSRVGKEYSYKYRLPKTYDPTNVKAFLQDGLLELTLTKPLETKPIEISVLTK